MKQEKPIKKFIDEIDNMTDLIIYLKQQEIKYIHELEFIEGEYLYHTCYDIITPFKLDNMDNIKIRLFYDSIFSSLFFKIFINLYNKKHEENVIKKLNTYYPYRSKPIFTHKNDIVMMTDTRFIIRELNNIINAVVLYHGDKYYIELYNLLKSYMGKNSEHAYKMTIRKEGYELETYKFDESLERPLPAKLFISKENNKIKLSDNNAIWKYQIEYKKKEKHPLYEHIEIDSKTGEAVIYCNEQNFNQRLYELITIL